MDPDELGPLVVETLTNACSQEMTILTPAEQQLQQWQTQPGFYTILSTIFCNHEIDMNVRWLSVMYIKNGVDRYWRRTAPNAMREEEKEIIKQRLLANFNEPSQSNLHTNGCPCFKDSSCRLPAKLAKPSSSITDHCSLYQSTATGESPACPPPCSEDTCFKTPCT
ncbi:hypothetical protein DPMN_103501 [Dreissena polymorpha]|uniref:Importin N-terminal domain-containing protein n=1 Tax=Dreissena polymorpha TaxID=45954 RepID=A0A9D4H864_DREPO|nr:hypothetical protein DPMN_103501 [Dreissena polymorpha]